MSEAPFFSIVSATFNLAENGRLQTFAQALASLHAQTFGNFEHIILDGGSKDGTVPFIRGLLQGDTRSTLISEPDRGVFDAYNRGISLARGKAILFLNSDDFYHDVTGLARTAERFNKSAEFVCSPVLIEKGDRRIIMDVDRLLFSRALWRMPFGHPGLAVSRRVFDEIGNFDITFKVAADYDFILRMLLHNFRYSILDTPYVTFRLGGLSSNKLDVANEKLRIWSKIYSTFGQFSDETFRTTLTHNVVPTSVLLAIMTSRHTNSRMRIASILQLLRTTRWMLSR